MPYDNVPTDNAPALPPTWEFTVDLSRATIVRGKGVPYLRLKSIFEAVGAAMKEANNPGN